MQERPILVHHEAEYAEVGTTYDLKKCSKISLEPGVPPETMSSELGTIASQILYTQDAKSRNNLSLLFPSPAL